MTSLFWFAIAIALIGISIAGWAALRILVLSREFNHPEIQEDVPHDERI